ncbi:hypothetical protein PIB30_067886 [Stylosanthes scabra]|uniref:Uncharacterized protein n=1 Tax=Stylosanthes scabra TaxID=79078 RepID=A0ABU6RMY4_9FABA|nr:hypothetical protein [Stylosanthes scabra]
MEKNIMDSRCFALSLFDRHNSEFEVTRTSPTGGFSLGTYQGYWPPYGGPTIIPDPRMMRARTNMDDVDPNQPRRCGLGRQVDHTWKNCDQRGSTAGDGV